MADPARVAVAINDVIDELTRWQYAAHMAADEASYIQSQATERVTHSDRLAALATHEHGENVVQLTRTISAGRKADDAASDAAAAIAFRSAAVAKASQFAEAMARSWRIELRGATDWLARAKARVRRAEAWVMRAREQVAVAQRAVSHAESNLSACNRDSDRKNCNREIAALREARILLAAAIHELQQAEEELRLAKEEEERAQRRVNCCTRAVRQTESARQAAEQASHEVEEAQHMASFAHDHASNALDCCGRAERAVGRQKIAADTARHAATAANESLQKASGQLRRAEGRYESARRLSFDGSSEMAQRVRDLRDFDRSVGL